MVSSEDTEIESWLTQENHDKGVTVKMSDGSTEAAFLQILRDRACGVQAQDRIYMPCEGCYPMDVKMQILHTYEKRIEK